MKDNNTVQCDERTLEHGFKKVKITHIPDKYGECKGMKDNNTVQRDERLLEHGSAKG